MNKVELMGLFGAVLNIVSVGMWTFFGITWGMYLMITLLSILCPILAFGYGSLNAGILTQEKIDEALVETKKGSKLLKFMYQLITGATVYTIFTMGFVFLSGVFAFSLLVGVISNFVLAIKMIAENIENDV